VNHVGIQPVAQRYRRHRGSWLAACLNNLGPPLGACLRRATLFVSIVSTCLFRGHDVYPLGSGIQDGMASRLLALGGFAERDDADFIFILRIDN